MNTAYLADLAATMNLNPVEAISLPTAVEIASSKLGMAQATFIAECHRIAELRDYLASACRAGAAHLTEA